MSLADVQPAASAAPGDNAIHWVSPKRINLATAGLNYEGRPPEVRAALRSEDAVLDGDWDAGGWGTQVKRIEDLDVYAALRDCLLGDTPWPESDYFQRVLRQIERGTPKWGCTTEAELLHRCEVELRGLYESMRTDGYLSQTDLATGRPTDEIRVGVRRDGRLVMFDGRHRLSLARLLGIDAVPIRIVVRHAEWVAFKDEVRTYAKDRLRGAVYQRIDHPDLSDLRAKHGDERFELLQGALNGYDPTGKRLLDIGTHWGHMPQSFERLGFACAGIELNPAAASIARRLRTATESEYEIWEGDLLDFEPGSFDVILAMSIFHHMIKTKRKHERLKALLGRTRADILFFEPHDPDLSAAQMADAYRNYEPDEFVGFVSEYAGLPNVTYVGKPDDRYRRPIYKLER